LCFAQVVLNLFKVQGGPQAEALGKMGQDLVDSVSDMVTRLSHGKGPKKSEVQTYDDFYKLVCKRMENFFTHTVFMGPSTSTSGGKLDFSPKSKRLVGIPAINAYFDHIIRAYAADPAQVLVKDLRCLKVHMWMLSDDAEKKVRELLQECCSSESSAALMDMVDSGGLEIVAVGAASSSSSSKLAAAEVAKPSKKTMKDDEKSMAKSAKMMKFFVPPAR
jgi:hypothetical protein